MGKYTVSKEADKKVEEDMRIIKEEIIKNIPSVISIFLTGGFSRGEGPVKKIEDKFYPYNDYDIQVITKTKIKKEHIDYLSEKISEKLGYIGIKKIFYPFRKEQQRLSKNFYVDLKADTPEELKNLLPRIRTYELKNCSKILYGKDTRNLISNYNLDKIPLAEGAKLLLDRMSQMIEYYSTERNYDKEFLTYIIQQAYAACCTALLMLDKKYQIGYKKSMKILKNVYKKDFPELDQKIPNLDKKIEQFIKWKINPKNLPNKNVEEEWFIAQKNILEVSKYFFSKFLGKKIENETDLAKAILDMKKKFYSPYIKEIIKRNIKWELINNSSLGGSKLLSDGASIILNRNYNKRLKKMGIQFKTPFFKSPDLIIFSSMIYLFSAIKKGNIVDKEKFEKSKKLLEKIYPVKGKNWEEISINYANAYIAFFMQKL